MLKIVIHKGVNHTHQIARGDHLIQRGRHCHPERKAELLAILSGAVGHVNGEEGAKA